MPDPEVSEQTLGRVAGLRARLGALLSQPFRSLPARIVTSVFSAALVTSLVVSWISTHSIESFLREKMDGNFPGLLHATSQRIDLYYAQRQLDVEIFARSAVVAANSARLSGPAAEASRRGAAHLSLATCSSTFRSTRRSSCSTRKVANLLWIGAELEIPAERRERAARVSAAHARRNRMDRRAARPARVGPGAERARANAWRRCTR